jgi:type I restriction enzyme R subunit
MNCGIKHFTVQNEWREKFSAVPFEDKSGTWQLRYYQEIAVNNAMEAIANKKQRILLTLATGVGKTAISFQIAWKLISNTMEFKTRRKSKTANIIFSR